VRALLIAGRNQAVGRLGLEDGFRALKAAGADAVELCHEHTALSPDRMTQPDGAAFARRVGAMVAGAGLKPSAVGWHCEYVTDEANFEKLLKLVPLAPQFGTDIFITSGVGRGEAPNKAQLLVERTRALCNAAEENGVRLAIEAEPGFLVGDADSLLRLCEQVGSDALCANLDLGHVFLVESDPVGAIRRLGSRTVHCHVEGMAKGVHKHLVPWEGDLNLAVYLRVLAELGFDGALALDLYRDDYPAVAPDCFTYLRAMLDALGH
jgi:sugar phosphate isomerase/epimerase